MKRGSDDELEGSGNKTSKRDRDDEAARRGRIRKKSAKVLEMEEFEEIEKKQLTTKPKGKALVSPASVGGPKKVKVKGGAEDVMAGMVTSLQGDALTGASAALPAPVPVPGLGPSVGMTPTPEAAPLSPTVKASTKQAIGAKVSKGQGSVIKLLLSSPTIPTTPSISTSAVTKTSTAALLPIIGGGVAGASSSIISVPTLPLQPSVKKSAAKVKKELKLEVEPSVEEDEDEEEELAGGGGGGGMVIKKELMDPQAGNLMLATSLAPDVLSVPQAVSVVKAEPSGTLTSTTVDRGLGSLKLKLLMTPKDLPGMEPAAVPVSGALPRMTTAIKSEKLDTPLMGSGTSTKKRAAPKKKKAAGEKAGKPAGSKSAAEQMPNLAALVSTPKQVGNLPRTTAAAIPVVKEERTLSLSDGLDANLSDASLDMSSIVESALDMEEEAALVIAEGNLAPAPSKPKKKRAPGSGAGKKKSKAAALAAAAAAAMDLDSDEGMSAPPEGDIAALAAKVQRSSASVGGKKKASKKSLEQQEAAAALQDKKKRPSRRAPTAYMLYCNSQRPKVVAESPGIDTFSCPQLHFAQISRTLGVMWQCLSKKEKMMWRRKSKKMAGKGSTLISTGKGSKKDNSASGGGATSAFFQAAATTAQGAATVRTSGGSKASSKTSASAAVPSALTGDDTPQSPVKGFGSEPIDIAAHLKLLGESLSIIGNRLQEHKGLIAVQGSLSVLLDSMLCACGPLLALTHQVPGLDGCSESTHARTLDSVAYIMPGL